MKGQNGSPIAALFREDSNFPQPGQSGATLFTEARDA
jgi:hypothetical protein